jgi:hypothetical protein
MAVFVAPVSSAILSTERYAPAGQTGEGAGRRKPSNGDEVGRRRSAAMLLETRSALRVSRIWRPGELWKRVERHRRLPEQCKNTLIGRDDFAPLALGKPHIQAIIRAGMRLVQNPFQSHGRVEHVFHSFVARFANQLYRHFEYRLVPMAADEKVHRGAPASAKPKVQ